MPQILDQTKVPNEACDSVKSASAAVAKRESNESKRYLYEVMYCKRSNKKLNKETEQAER